MADQALRVLGAVAPAQYPWRPEEKHQVETATTTAFNRLHCVRAPACGVWFDAQQQSVRVLVLDAKANCLNGLLEAVHLHRGGSRASTCCCRHWIRLQERGRAQGGPFGSGMPCYHVISALVALVRLDTGANVIEVPSARRVVVDMFACDSAMTWNGLWAHFVSGAGKARAFNTAAEWNRMQADFSVESRRIKPAAPVVDLRARYGQVVILPPPVVPVVAPVLPAPQQAMRMPPVNQDRAKQITIVPTGDVMDFREMNVVPLEEANRIVPGTMEAVCDPENPCWICMGPYEKEREVTERGRILYNAAVVCRTCRGKWVHHTCFMSRATALFGVWKAHGFNADLERKFSICEACQSPVECSRYIIGLSPQILQERPCVVFHGIPGDLARFQGERRAKRGRPAGEQEESSAKRVAI